MICSLPASASGLDKSLAIEEEANMLTGAEGALGIRVHEILHRDCVEHLDIRLEASLILD